MLDTLIVPKMFHSVSVILFLISIRENGREGDLQGAEAIFM